MEKDDQQPSFRYVGLEKEKYKSRKQHEYFRFRFRGLKSDVFRLRVSSACDFKLQKDKTGNRLFSAQNQPLSKESN